MDLSKKQTNKMLVIGLLQTLLSTIAFIIITYILINVEFATEKLIYLVLDTVIIGFIINGVFTFIKAHRSL